MVTGIRLRYVVVILYSREPQSVSRDIFCTIKLFSLFNRTVPSFTVLNNVLVGRTKTKRFAHPICRSRKTWQTPYIQKLNFLFLETLN